MQISLKQFDKNTIAIFYKLLHDSLFVLIIFFSLTLIAEAVLPGIIISHIGFSKIVIVLLLNIFLIKFLAEKISNENIAKKNDAKNKSLAKFASPFIILGALLLFNDQLGMNLFLNLFIILICGIIGYLSYQILFNEE
ncbi:MAG: hypothetical protein WC848_03890 [Parcubacteria group bacterium]